MPGNRFRDHRAIGPGHVRGQDHGGDPVLSAGEADGGERIGADVGCAHGATHPTRDGARHRIDIRLQWRVIAFVICRVVTDDHQHRDVRATGVVQVC